MQVVTKLVDLHTSSKYQIQETAKNSKPMELHANENLQHINISKIHDGMRA